VADANPPKDIVPADDAFSQRKLIAIETTKPSPSFGASTLPTSASLPNAQSFIAPGAHEPRYVIDARPASYEPAAAYSF
jgi:hypothetical protein